MPNKSSNFILFLLFSLLLCLLCISPAHCGYDQRQSQGHPSPFPPPAPTPPRDVHWNQNAVLIWPWAFPRVKLWLSLLEKLYFVNSCFLEGDTHLPPSRTGVALDISVSSCKLFTLSFVQEEEWLVWLVRWWEADSSKASSPKQGG